MQSNTFKSMLTFIAAGFTAALMIGWGLGLSIFEQAIWTRWLLIVFCAAASFCCFYVIQKKQKHSKRLLHRSFLRLCSMDHNDLADCDPSSLLPTEQVDQSWLEVFDQTRDSLMAYAKRTQAAEHSRASCEVHALRNDKRAEQLQSILDSLAEPIIAFDEYEEVLLSNQSAAELFDFDFSHKHKRSLNDLNLPEVLGSLITESCRRKNSITKSIDFEFANDEGTYTYRATARGLDNHGEAADIESRTTFVVMRDISSHKALQKRNAEFVSAVSHEMKTPLSGIKAYVELLLDGDAEDDETREEFLEVINGQADRLKRLIDNLLNLARIEAGVVEVTKEPQSLNEILEATLQIVQPSAEQKNITLASEFSSMLLRALVDHDMITQAAINLLSNAIKYTPEGGTVTFRSRMNDDRIEFSVSDTGVGLSEEDCGKVFEKFYRVKKNKDMAPGTGLGLPLAKHIVEDVHSGQLTCSSILGEGSTFTISLPSAGQLTHA